MKQEQRHVNEFGQEYMKSLKKVEDMVRDKDSERWRKKMGKSVNIGEVMVQSENINAAQSRATSRQKGDRPQKLTLKGRAVNEDLP